MTRSRGSALILLVVLSVASPATLEPRAADADAGKTVVYRDEYGVPHIYAPKAEAGLFAMGWAQAEDRLEELLKNYLRATGEMAAAFGMSELTGDVQARLWRHYEVAQKNGARIRPEVRRHMAWFVQGINHYLAAHRDEVPEWWGDRKVDVDMVVAHSRQFMWGWPAGQALAELGAAGVRPNFGADSRSSNEMAIAASRSAVRAPILVIDPHLSWWGAQRFWEFRIHAGELRGSGFTIPGSPYVGLGHNDHVAWAMTTGGPDTADIYRLELDPQDPLRYRYEGGWKSLVPRIVSIRVRGEEKSRQFTFHDSHYGPVVARKGNEGFAAKLSYADEVQFGEAFYLFNIARNVAEFQRGLQLNQLMPQNVMVADTSGGIYYQRAGRVPIRPDGFDFSRPVDGSTSRSEWLGIHPAGDLISISDPPQGYMQNCNISPDVMMVGSPMTPERYRSYLFNERPRRLHQRGARALELLAAAGDVTPERAIEIALDTGCYQYERWTTALKEADARFGAPFHGDADYAGSLRDILEWDGFSRADSKGALKFYHWRRALRELLGSSHGALVGALTDYMAAAEKPRPTREAVTPEALKGMTEALAAAARTLRSDFGTLDVPYGQVFRVGRDEVSWPVGGGSLQEEGMATVRAIAFAAPKADHTRWGSAGQTSTQVVVLSKPVKSWTQPPIGQSDRKGSPFYRDQAEKLFSPAKMKPTWYAKTELLRHVHSRSELSPVRPK